MTEGDTAFYGFLLPMMGAIVKPKGSLSPAGIRIWAAWREAAGSCDTRQSGCLAGAVTRPGWTFQLLYAIVRHHIWMDIGAYSDLVTQLSVGASTGGSLLP